MWAAHSYFKREGVTTHSGGHRHSLQCEGRPDWRLGVLAVTWNIDSLNGKVEEV